MTASLIVSALCLLLVGTLVGVRAVRAARERHWLGGTIRGLVALLLLALAALAATLTVGLHGRSEEHTSELQSHSDLVCRLLLEKKKNIKTLRNNDTQARATERQHVD